MPEESKPENLQVFINYSHEDSLAAKRLYEELKNAGFSPWFDKESLIPGQSWQKEIDQVIKNSRYFIPIFSSTSVRKRGFIQKEFAYALKSLEDTSKKIYIIPVRLDDCEIPYQQFNNLTYLDLFPSWDEGFKKLISSMKITDTFSSYRSSSSYMDSKKNTWIQLLRYIEEKKCVPIIGDEAHIVWLSSDKDLANKWSYEYDFPLKEINQLSTIAQFLALEMGDDIYPKRKLSKYINNISLPDFTNIEHSHTIYGILADLNLPIYITTNYDHIMEEVLRSRGKNPVSEFCRWNESLQDYVRSMKIPSVFDKGSRYNVNPSTPLVYHLYGDFTIPQSMVLTTKDYFDFITNLSREDEKLLLPSVIRRSLVTSSLLFIGYKMEDIKFNSIFLSILNYKGIRYLPNIVIFDPLETVSNNKIEKANEFLEKYTKKIFNAYVILDNVSEFSEVLRIKWEEFKRN